MKFSQRQIFIIAGAAAVVILFLIIIFFGLRSSGNAPVSLAFWGFEREDVLRPIIDGYRQLRPNVTINYRQVSRGDYKNQLLNALASTNGPDVFPIHNRWLPKEKDKLSPVSPQQFTVSQLEDLFPTVVEQDFSFSTSSQPASRQIYALPLYLDTLALIYNKDLFDSAAVVSPPKNWTEFQSLIPRLRSLSPNGQIQKAAAAIGGTTKTIRTATDILNVLMLQNSTQMIEPDFRQATFASTRGLEAFNFYLQFGNSGTGYYAWNDNQPDWLESFSSGQTAVIFGYYSDYLALKNKAPFQNIGAAPLPQIAGANAVSYADYWGLAVSKQSQVSGWAWDFIIYLTTQPEVSQIYLQATNQPPALRTLIGQNLNDPVLGVFTKQALSSRSWYEIDEQKINDIFDKAITGTLSGRFSPDSALRQAQDQISQLMSNF